MPSRSGLVHVRNKVARKHRRRSRRTLGPLTCLVSRTREREAPSGAYLVHVRNKVARKHRRRSRRVLGRERGGCGARARRLGSGGGERDGGGKEGKLGHGG